MHERTPHIPFLPTLARGVLSRFRLPVPFSVLAAACTTGCCSFCIRPPGPDFFEGVHEAYSTDRDPAFAVERLAANPAVDRRVDWLERWGGSPDGVLLDGARWRARRIRPEDYPDADEISLLEWEETGYWTNGYSSVRDLYFLILYYIYKWEKTWQTQTLTQKQLPLSIL